MRNLEISNYNSYPYREHGRKWNSLREASVNIFRVTY